MKSQFFGTLCADHIEGKWWRLREPLAFYSARYGITVCAPAGFVTDFASVPRLPLAWLIAGGTGHWEAVIHDVPYRFGLPPRRMADPLLFESGRVRSGMRANQTLVHRTGRLARTSLMTGMVSAVGWINYDPVPGCLDYRGKNRCGRNCQSCKNYYPAWSRCLVPGYAPNILDMHRGTDRKGES